MNRFKSIGATRMVAAFVAWPLLGAVSGPAAAQAAGPWQVRTPSTAAPVAPALDAAGEGRRQYLRLNCYGCHGMAAAGGMGPLIIGKERHDVSEVLKRGEDGGMPSYRNWVTETDITNITAYLQSIGTPNEPTFNDWWRRVPPK